MNGDVGDRWRRSNDRGRNRREKEERSKKRKWLTRDAQIWPNECCSNCRVDGWTDGRTWESILEQKLKLYIIRGREKFNCLKDLLLPRQVYIYHGRGEKGVVTPR